MMYHIPGVLSPQDVARFREQLEQAEWVDGRVTTGAQGAQVKNNQQVDTRSTLYAALPRRPAASSDGAGLNTRPRRTSSTGVR